MRGRAALWVALATLVAANAWLIGEGLINRAGEAQAHLSVDECRLYAGFGDDPGLRLRTISRFRPPDSTDGPALFGIDPDEPPTTMSRTARHAYVALTPDGEIPGDGRHPPIPSPRLSERNVLFVFDAAPDAATLRDRYGDRDDVAIARGLVRLRSQVDPETGRATDRMTLAPDLRESTLHLSLAQRRTLQRLGRPEAGTAPGAACRPRFVVDIAFGSQYLPYVLALRPISGAGDKPATDPGPE